jgi:uncharacterized protein
MSVASLDITERGPAGDRRYMLVDNDGRFVSQRQFPALAHLQAREEGTNVIISQGDQACRASPTEHRRPVTIWKDTLEAADCGPDMAQFLSDYLKFSVRLVWLPDDVRRPVDTKYAPERETTFTDGYPLLVVNLSSLKALNEGLKVPVGIERFRPNIVVEHEVPFAEDRWGDIVAGTAKLRGVKPCARCVVITVDQTTGNKDDTSQVLQRLAEQHTLKSFGAVFGMNLVIDTPGVISVGDEFHLR